LTKEENVKLDMYFKTEIIRVSYNP